MARQGEQGRPVGLLLEQSSKEILVAAVKRVRNSWDSEYILKEETFNLDIHNNS